MKHLRERIKNGQQGFGVRPKKREGFGTYGPTYERASWAFTRANISQQFHKP